MGTFGMIASIAGALGIGSVVTLIVRHWLDKKKYTVQVKGDEVRVEGDQLKVDESRYDFQTKRIDDLKTWVEELRTSLEEEKRMRAEQEGICDSKIARLNSIVSELRDDMSKAKRRCDNNCFANSDAA